MNSFTFETISVLSNVYHLRLFSCLPPPVTLIFISSHGQFFLSPLHILFGTVGGFSHTDLPWSHSVSVFKYRSRPAASKCLQLCQSQDLRRCVMWWPASQFSLSILQWTWLCGEFQAPWFMGMACHELAVLIAEKMPILSQLPFLLISSVLLWLFFLFPFRHYCFSYNWVSLVPWVGEKTHTHTHTPRVHTHTPHTHTHTQVLILYTPSLHHDTWNELPGVDLHGDVVRSFATQWLSRSFLQAHDRVDYLPRVQFPCSTDPCPLTGAIDGESGVIRISHYYYYHLHQWLMVIVYKKKNETDGYWWQTHSDGNHSLKLRLQLGPSSLCG